KALSAALAIRAAVRTLRSRRPRILANVGASGGSAIERCEGELLALELAGRPEGSVEVAPAVAGPDEERALDEGSVAALGEDARREQHLAAVAFDARVVDRQAAVAQLALRAGELADHLGLGPGAQRVVGVEGAKEVGALAEREGAEAGADELARVGGLGALVEAPAAGAVRRAAAAWARAGSLHRPR